MYSEPARVRAQWRSRTRRRAAGAHPRARPGRARALGGGPRRWTMAPRTTSSPGVLSTRRQASPGQPARPQGPGYVYERPLRKRAPKHEHPARRTCLTMKPSYPRRTVHPSCALCSLNLVPTRGAPKYEHSNATVTSTKCKKVLKYTCFWRRAGRFCRTPQGPSASRFDANPRISL